MAEQEYSTILEQIDLYSLIRDVVRNLWAILLGAIAVAMIVNMVVQTRYENTYSTSATFVVSSRTSSNYTYSNLSAAANMADSFTNLLESRIMKKRVCQDLGVESFNAVTDTQVLNGTNLLVLNVTSDTPQNAYMITRSIMRNIDGLTQYVSDDMVLDVLQEPSIPLGANEVHSAAPQTKKAFLAAAAVLVLLFGYLSFLKQTIKSEKDLENKLDSRSLGLMYYTSKYSSLRSFLKRRPNRHLITDVTAGFEFVERFRKISTMVTQQAQKHDAKVILITSVQEHEGKTTVSANIALTLAQQGKNVLLADCDLRRPSQFRFFLKPKERLEASFMDLLIGKVNMRTAHRYDEEKKIHLLLNTHNYANSTDIVSSGNMKQFISLVRDHYDYIILDTPPMALMADAEVIADLADLSVLVVKYDTMLAEDLNDAIDSLRDCKAHFAGCILNQVRTLPGTRRTIGGYGNYGGYGSYGRYGHYGRYGNYSKRGEETA